MHTLHQPLKYSVTLMVTHSLFLLSSLPPLFTRNHSCCSLTHSLTHPLIYSLIGSFTHSLTQVFIHSWAYSLIGLLTQPLICAHNRWYKRNGIYILSLILYSPYSSTAHSSHQWPSNSLNGALTHFRCHVLAWFVYALTFLVTNSLTH